MTLVLSPLVVLSMARTLCLYEPGKKACLVDDPRTAQILPLIIICGSVKIDSRMMGFRSSETNDLEFVEMDPSRRYGRYDEILGKGASKTVYRAFDEYEGMEVAWNQVKLYDFLQRPEDLERLYSEIHLLKTLKHKNIMKFYTSWVDVANRRINFVTELFTSGTLRQYRQRHKRVNLRAVRHWCRQILRGLLHLHSHDPPVIHRDLKCDNIFVNGNQGEVKIGDLGLAAILRNSHAAHCVGTPEFMAPEVYQEEYNELVDIYSFGMCVLEMVTFEYPYSECTHPAQIYQKVVSGTKPEALNRVNNNELRAFVDKCLVKVSSRLSARELLKDPFLQIDDYEPDIQLPKFDHSVYDVNPRLVQPLFAIYHGNGTNSNGCSSRESENIWSYEITGQDMNGNGDFTQEDVIQSANVAISIRGQRKEDGEIFLSLRITDKEGRVRNIYFPFDTSMDTALSVAIEMVAELDMNDEDAAKIADMIDEEVSVLVPESRSGPGVKEDQYPKTYNHCHSQRCSTGSFYDYCCSNNRTSLECTAMHGRFGEITYQSRGSGEEELSLHSNKSNGDSWPPHEFTYTISEGSVREASDEETGNLDEFLLNVKKSSMSTLPDNHEGEIQQELKLPNTKYQIQEQEQSANFKNRVNGYIGCRSKGAEIAAYYMSKFSSGKHLASCNGSLVMSGSSVLINRSAPSSEGTQSNESSPELFTAKRYYAGADQPYPASKGRSRRH